MRLIPSGCSEAIDATPTHIQPINGNSWLFSYGEPIIGREVGAANLIPGKHHYTRFKIVAWQSPDSDDAPLPAYQPVSERPLTAEEIALFEALAQQQKRRD